MKKFAIISVSIVLLISVVCIAAFAFWDTTTGNVEFTGSSIGSSIALKTAVASTANTAGVGKKLVSQDAVAGTNDAKLVCVGAVTIKIETAYSDAEWKKLVTSLKFSITKFNLAFASLTNYADVFDFYLTNDKAGNGTKVKAEANFYSSVKDKLKDGYTMYAFLQYKNVSVDGTTYAAKAIDMTVQFTIA